jgi:hypothetical protein
MFRMTAGGALVVALACGSGPGISTVHLGEPVATAQGNAVTVYGWRPTGDPEGGGHPGLTFKSCRSRPKGLVLNASAFALRTTAGAVLQASGSRLSAAGQDCVTGELLFNLPAGARPEYATYRAGATLLRWRLGDAPG